MIARYTLFVLGVLALIGGVVLSVAYFRQPQATAEIAAKAPPPRSVLAAAHGIPPGTLLRLEDMAWIDVPASETTSASIVRGQVNEADLLGSVTNRAFIAREPLAVSALVKPGDRDFLVATLAPGYRAVSVNVDAAQGTAGLVLPGDRVDVILTQNFSVKGDDQRKKTVGETVLRDLRVIAKDQTFNIAPKSAIALMPTTTNEYKTPKTVTLEVTERQGEILLVADQLGKIQLALRGRETPSTTPPKPLPPLWASDVSPALLATGPVASNEPEPLVNHPTTIEVIHGSKIEKRCSTRAGLVACQGEAK